jgi:hypothetical protein
VLPPASGLPGAGSPPGTAPGGAGGAPPAGSFGWPTAGTAPGTAAETESARRSALAGSVRITRTRFSTHGPAANRGTVITFRLRRAGKVLLVVRSGASSCAVLGRRQVAGVRGLNRVRFMGRVHGRTLPPGQYMVDVVVVRGKRHKRVGRVSVEIVRPGRHLTRAQRVAPVATACAIVSVSPSLPAAVVGTRSVDRGGRGGGQGSAGNRSTAERVSRSGVLGAVFKAPRIPGLTGGDEGGGGGLAWLGLGLYLVLFAAFLTVLLYVARFLRGSWNP